MMKKFALLLFFMGTSLWMHAQKQERKEYFQQEVNYSIDVTLDDVNHTLKGFERIEYINNSPDELTHLYFHLWPNAYRNRNTALAKQLLENGETDFYFSDPANNYGYIDSLHFVIDGDTVKWEYDSLHCDIAFITLNKILKPGKKIIIETPFFVKLPASFSRLGHVGQSYQITQWYPKPAVYDRNGWNQMPYLDQGEFYSEYGSFDVRITVPSNYVVGATGDLFECFEEEKWLEIRAKETQKLLDDKKLNKVGQIDGPWDDEFPASSATTKTLRYKQKNVHDFAWFADKRFYVLRGEYNLPKSDRNVTLWAMFTKENSRYWAKSIQYIHDACKYYSKWNGEYPYNQITAVDGTISAGGGMEYPTITVIGSVGSDISLETVIMHEVGHNWFYGILGSNERLHPWMDEGLNSFNELRYIETKYPELSLANSMIPGTGVNSKFGLNDFKQRSQYLFSYLLNARRNFDQPIEGKAEEFTATNYGGIVYSKTAIAFDYLRFYLGEKTFDRCMQAYYEKWKFKHPEPEDLQEVFQETAKEDLRWFFEDVIKEDLVIDYKIKKKKKIDRASSKTYMWMKYEEKLVIVNKGSANVPFAIQGYKGDTVNTTVWYGGHTGTATVAFPNGPYDYYKIDGVQRIPEVNQENNYMKEKGMFRNIEPVKFQFLAGIDNPKRSVIYWTPVVGANAYDGFQAGLLLYNNLFPQRNFEWKLMPMFGFKSQRLSGYADFTIHQNTRKSELINNIDYTVRASSFRTGNWKDDLLTTVNGFAKVEPEILIRLRKKKMRSIHDHFISIKSSLIIEDTVSKVNDGVFYIQAPPQGSSFTYYNELKYLYKNSKTLHPWWASFTLQHHKDFLRAQVELDYKWIYNIDGKYINFRFFGGKFFTNNTNSSRFNYRMDGQRGYHDFTYSSVFPGRMEYDGFWSRQFLYSYGGMKVPTANGQSNNWLIAANLRAELPIPILKVFADFGVAQPGTEVTALYDAGVYVSLFRGFCDVYVPLVFSSDIQDEFTANGYGFGDRIRFTLNLDLANPFKQIKNIKP